MVQRWCDPKDLELVRTSPHKAARVSGVVGRAPSKTSHRPGISSDSGSDSDLDLAAHEKGRQLPQALRGTGIYTGVALAASGRTRRRSLYLCALCSVCMCVVLCVAGGEPALRADLSLRTGYHR